MKKRDIIKLLENFDDDFNVELNYYENIPEEELQKMSYPYPYKKVAYDLIDGDISYSEKSGYLELIKQEEE